ncbi:MAG TPA: D-TA family PLP-dependent enzyme [Candidatus Acidoferrum sp.]|nr:D-TA family PLP-dependent enzyme [Candidatus Acidoferrum sp.]
MAPPKMLLPTLNWEGRFLVENSDDVMTPALLIYPDAIASNIGATLKVLHGNADRWRAHVKTAKLAFTMRMMADRGVTNFKCATTLELLVACQSGARDVLVAYPVVGANARRVREIADSFPGVRVSILAENEAQAIQWRGSRVGVFLDINPGMDRTGVEQDHHAEIVGLVGAIQNAGLEFRGLHYYDGHFGGVDESERVAAAHRGYERLLAVVAAVEQSGASVEEVITAGTPTFPASASFQGFHGKRFVHRISPGTIVYNDATSLAQLPSSLGLKPAVLVMTRVVSHPHSGKITCDAGHKSVSADAGLPTCVVVGHPELTPLGPSEEHLPMSVAEGSTPPKVGEILYLLPRHVCPTVNNFDLALVVRDNKIDSLEKVSARGREIPFLGEVPRSAAAS